MTIGDGLINAGPRTLEESQAVMAVNRGKPHRFSFGYSRVGPNGAILDYFPVVDNLKKNHGTASVAAYVLNIDELKSGTYKLSLKDVVAIRNYLTPFEQAPGDHINIKGLDKLAEIMRRFDTARHERLLPEGYHDIPVMVVQMEGDNVQIAGGSVGEAFLRLILNSRRDVELGDFNFDGIFGALINVAWTNHGPVQIEDVEQARREIPGLFVLGVDRFPRMVDYVIPSGIRIPDADRVRLGAQLAEGTVVMHAGFVNFNAGTRGPGMVEGRVSAGVYVGKGTDIGGGVSILGTLSGGNDTVVSIGEYCLLEANCGLGIPIGDRVRVEAGFYLKGTLLLVPLVGVGVWDDNPIVKAALAESGTGVVKASALAGVSDVIFRRNSITGVAEVIPRGDRTWGKLNEMLHAN